MSHERERFDRLELLREHKRVVDLSPQEAVLEIGRFGVADARYYDSDLLKELERLKAVEVKNDVAALAYWGPQENRVEHDLAVHREYCEYRLAIEKDGGRVLEIRTEAEFFSDLGRATGRSRNMRADVDDFARANDLSVIDGKLRIPDCRIVYELDGIIDRIDLEIASAHRGSKAVQAKQSAGMRIVDRNNTSRTKDRHDDLARMLR